MFKKFNYTNMKYVFYIPVITHDTSLMSVMYNIYSLKMFKPVIQRLCRHKSASASTSIITTIKTVDSYRITLSDPKTRYNYNTFIKFKLVLF